MALTCPLNQCFVLPMLGKPAEPLPSPIARQQINDIGQIAWSKTATDRELDCSVELETLPTLLDHRSGQWRKALVHPAAATTVTKEYLS